MLELKLSKNWILRITKYWYGLYCVTSPVKAFSVGFLHFVYRETVK